MVDDKSEIVQLDVWHERRKIRKFTIITIYSPPKNKPDFSFIDRSPGTIFLGDFNAHFPLWGYNDIKPAGRAVEDLLIRAFLS